MAQGNEPVPRAMDDDALGIGPWPDTEIPPGGCQEDQRTIVRDGQGDRPTTGRPDNHVGLEPIMGVLGLVDYHKLHDWAWLFYGATTALLVFVISPLGYLLTKWLGGLADTAAAALFHVV